MKTADECYGLALALYWMFERGETEKAQMELMQLQRDAYHQARLDMAGLVDELKPRYSQEESEYEREVFANISGEEEMRKKAHSAILSAQDKP